MGKEVCLKAGEACPTGDRGAIPAAKEGMYVYMYVYVILAHRGMPQGRGGMSDRRGGLTGQ